MAYSANEWLYVPCKGRTGAKIANATHLHREGMQVSLNSLRTTFQCRCSYLALRPFLAYSIKVDSLLADMYGWKQMDQLKTLNLASCVGMSKEHS